MKSSKKIITAIYLSCISVSLTAGDIAKLAQPKESVFYTHIGKCSETITNRNATFSKLQCEKVGSYDLSISIQQPTYFTINLNGPLGEANSEFEAISGELPIETGPAIEWQLINSEPRYMIYRVSWGSKDTPFVMNERLILNYVSKDRICALATVDTKKSTQPNIKARELINEQFSSISQCPASVKAY